MLKTIKAPDGSNWGRWGTEDTLGTLNLITGESVKRAVKLVSTGESLSLSLPLDIPHGNWLNPNRFPPVVRPNLRYGRPNFLFDMESHDNETTGILNDDFVVLHSQFSTQWDALSHVGCKFDADGDGVAEIRFYNGFSIEDFVGPQGTEGAGLDSLPGETTLNAGPLSISAMNEKPIQTRGVLIDIVKHFGEGEFPISNTMLQHVISAESIELESGDVLLIHTGFATDLKRKASGSETEIRSLRAPGLDGTDSKLLEWLRTSNIAAIASDNLAVELPPSRDGSKKSYLPLHEHCIFRLGMPLGELWYMEKLAAKVSEMGTPYFMLTAPPLNIPGVNGSPVTPIATF